MALGKHSRLESLDAMTSIPPLYTALLNEGSISLTRPLIINDLQNSAVKTRIFSRESKDLFLKGVIEIIFSFKEQF
jgi:hypothetical protein